MKAVLLIRESAFQIYCANRLFQAGILESVVVEAGVSVPRARPTLREALSGIRVEVWEMGRRPIARSTAALTRLANLVNRRRYYGDREFHEQRLLRDYRVLEPALTVVPVDSVNSPVVISYLQGAKPDLAFVHGTGLIRRHVLDAVTAPFVNLHWGWSPDYRGEGVVSALALEGPAALGVTVHVIDEGIDSGDILYRARPIVDPFDNFYSIGLKLTVLGTELFLRVADDFARHGTCSGTKQVRQPSQLFSGRYLREHPDLYRAAWSTLRRGVRR